MVALPRQLRIYTFGAAALMRLNVRLWHVCDLARSLMDFRFRGKNGHAADITQ
jgi:hypothetical protein